MLGPGSCSLLRRGRANPHRMEREGSCESPPPMSSSISGGHWSLQLHRQGAAGHTRARFLPRGRAPADSQLTP